MADITPIAHIETPFAEKFGVPRQSGVADCSGRIVFAPAYRDPAALRGLEEFSHIWLIWQFSQAVREDWSPTVRPPRLGGNRRMGVFATRSPFRPNAMGLSSVQLDRVELDPQLGPVLHVRGADLMDGTPIFDIKPYLAYTDSHPQATGGFTDGLAHAPLTVDCARSLLEQLTAEGCRAMMVQADVSQQDQVTAMVRQVEDAFGPVSLLVNNAGVAGQALFQDISDELWHRYFSVNVDGAFYCIRAALPHMLRQQSGCILNVSSMWGQVGASCEAAYSATKGAILALTKALAQELGPSGIRVNAVAPGVIQTDMCAHVDPAVMESLRQQTPIERLGTPEDIARAMVYLADAAFITGQVLPVNGGFVIT